MFCSAILTVPSTAFIFNTMLTAGVLEMIVPQGPVEHAVRGAFVGVCVISFLVFSPLAYGIPVDANKQTLGYVKSLKWLDTWGF